MSFAAAGKGPPGSRPGLGLYVHVPFCAHKCEYCAFYSHPANGEVVNRYVAALIKELERLPCNLRPHTVFFGGGTPSMLNLLQWDRVLSAMSRLNLLGASEWTVECNPATLSLEKARLLRSFGVNRVSLGVQSLDEALLERLGRVHSRQMVFKSIDILRRAGFDNVNLDLMFAIPGQTLRIWEATLDEALKLGSEHLSCYEVIYEEDTPLYEQLQAAQFAVDDDLACRMYDLLVDKAAAQGFHQYEIANFARHLSSGPAEVPDHACQHNVNYWRAGSFHGAGPSATGYVGGRRTRNWSNTALYCELLESDRSPVESSEELAPLARAGEAAAFGLRMLAGWPYEQFRHVTGFDLRHEWAGEIQDLLRQGLAQTDGQRLQLTRRGLRFADLAAERFIRLDAPPVAAR